MKISTFSESTDQEPYATFYRAFIDKGLNVPKPLVLMSASPSLFNIYKQILMHYITHDTLQPGLLACIRYAIAYRSHFAACVAMNRDILRIHEVTDLTYLEQERPWSGLTDTESQIFSFTMDALFHPDQVTEFRMQQLTSMEISEQHLFEAAFHGSLLLMMGPLVASLG